MLNPKEKALQLVVKFIKHFRAEKDLTPLQSAKECALIAIQEVRDNLPLTSNMKQYLNIVEKEIEIL
jgi:hypothetical protein